MPYTGSLKSKADIGLNPFFQVRIVGAVVEHAFEVLAEVPDPETGWPERGVLAGRVLDDTEPAANEGESPQGSSRYLFMPVAIDDSIVATYESTSPPNIDNITDQQIRDRVAEVWNQIAGHRE